MRLASGRPGLVIALCSLAAACGSGGASGPAASAAPAAVDAPGASDKPREARFTTDDGVSIYYRVIGGGEETVIVPMAIFLEDALARLASPKRRLVFYDPRNRGRSGRAPLTAVSLDRQLKDLEQLRQALGAERIALIGWSGLGMEMAVYAIRHPDRVTRLVQVGAVPPSARIMSEAGDGRTARMDKAAVDALDRRFEAGEFAANPADFCRQRERLTTPSNFADPAIAERVPDTCQWENEWPLHLWPYYGAFLGTVGNYDWLHELETLTIPRLVIHGREDGIPLAGAHAWTAGFPTARLLVLSPAGHFPFLERPDEFFPAVDMFLGGAWPPAAVAVKREGG
jgi:proline iminopeptidase